jgi:hypothetical protein
VIGKEHIAVIARNRSEMSLGEQIGALGHRFVGKPNTFETQKSGGKAKSQELKAKGQQLAADRLVTITVYPDHSCC